MFNVHLMHVKRMRTDRMRPVQTYQISMTTESRWFFYLYAASVTLSHHVLKPDHIIENCFKWHPFSISCLWMSHFHSFALCPLHVNPFNIKFSIITLLPPTALHFWSVRQLVLNINLTKAAAGLQGWGKCSVVPLWMHQIRLYICHF